MLRSLLFRFHFTCLFSFAVFNENHFFQVELVRDKKNPIMHISRFENYDKLSYSIIQYYLATMSSMGLDLLLLLPLEMHWE